MQLGDEGGVVGLLVGELRFEPDDDFVLLVVDAEEASNLGILRERGAPENVDSGLAREVHHAVELIAGRRSALRGREEILWAATAAS